MKNFNWKKTNAPTMNGGRTDDIWFVDKDNGWAVNSNGQILATTDGGHTWTEQLRLEKTYLRCLSFSSSKNGWAGTVSSAKRLFQTVDAGDNWVEVKNLPPHLSAICGICAVSNDVVYASGTNYPNRPCAIIKTLDGGKSWIEIDMSKYANLLVDIYFINANKGWVVGGIGGSVREKVKPVILYTEDGGKSWINQVADIQLELPLGEWGWKIQILNPLVGFVSLENFSDGAILKTTDGGKHWKRMQVNDAQENANLEGIGFLDENIGWVGGWGNKNFTGGYSSQTLDGGKTWKNANEVGKFLNRFRFIGDPVQLIYASGDSVYKFSEPSEVFNAQVNKMAIGGVSLFFNEDSRINPDGGTIGFNIPEGTAKLSINVYNRFAAHVQTLLETESPVAGKTSVPWPIPQSENRIDLQHFIVRISTDKVAESKIFTLSSKDDHSLVLKSIEEFVALNRDKSGNFPSATQEKEAFFRMVNIEDYPDFRPLAKDLAEIYLASTDYNTTGLYNEFSYTEEAFETRMSDIYNAVLPDMYKPHRYDQEVISWENGRNYKVGKASDQVAKDRILQMAPFNLMDGFWLQNILQARPSDSVQSKLFAIWSDEAGNGDVQHNHSNIYLDLLRSQGYYLPEVTSREFLQIDVADGAWRSPVFEMCIGLFPQHFFPELLGMTLYLEWEATPTMPPIANMFKGRGINPLFYALHAAIDNIDEGHGALAKQAIKIYLDEKREEGGEKAVQENWKRIWNGYVGWATSGSNGAGLEERRLLIDNISINIGTPEEPVCFPDWKEIHKNKMIGLIKKKAPFARQVHGNAVVEGVLLNKLFDNPDVLMDKMLTSGLFNIQQPRHSKFFKLLEFEGPMYKVFSEDEKNTILNWLESLSADYSTCIEPIDNNLPDPSTIFPLVNSFLGMARRAHDSLTLPDETGVPQPFINYLEDPQTLLKAMIRGGWIIPGSSERSMFIQRILLNDGPMQGVFDDNQVAMFESWIDQGANTEEKTKQEIASLKNMEFSGEIQANHFLLVRPFIGQGAVH